MKTTTSIASLLIVASFASTAQAQGHKRLPILSDLNQASAAAQMNLEPVPAPSESVDLGTDPNATAIIYNPRTGEEIAFDRDLLKRVLTPEADASGRKALTGNLGADGSSPAEESTKVLGDDSRVKVTNTKAYPYRYTVKLVVLGQNNKVFGGTGIMINDRYVLTCGHNVYNSAFGGSWYAKEIAAVPGMNGTADNVTCRPFGSAVVTNWLVWNAWTNGTFNASYDLAVLELDKPIGNTTGWAGLEYTPENNIWGYTAGYPMELTSGAYMYKHNQTTTWGQSNPEMIYHKMDATKGQSGSGIWELYEGKHYVFAVHTGEHTDLWNRGVRITESKFDIIVDWVFGS